MPEKKEDEFAFIKEKIKDKPISKRELLSKAAVLLVAAVVFGLIACFVITLVQPYMEKWLYPEEKPVVTIPKDELRPDTEEETERDLETENAAPVYITETQELEITDYQKLQNKIYAIGEEQNQSIVTVTGVKSDMDWFNTPYESSGQASGVIIANNGQELLILTEKKVITDAQAIRVTFMDGTIVNAVLKQYDGNTGVAVLSVALSDIPNQTLGAVKTAVLGNSYMVEPGTVVIALGSPLGANFSILAGDITATENSVSTLDATYHVLNTDIVGSSSGSGVLINLNGEVIGLIMQGYSSSGDMNTLTAVSISELKEVIEMLSNNQSIPYLGAKLSTVTDEISASYDLPKGAYVKSVEMDSPAMNAGLQSGDVIVELNGAEITTVSDYTDKLRSLLPNTNVSITVKRQGTDGYTKITCTAVVGVLE